MTNQICRTCSIDKPITEFYEGSYTRKDGTKAKIRSCKSCRIATNSKQREGDKRSKYLAYMKEYSSNHAEDRRRRAIEMLVWIDSIKSGKPCLDCGGTFPPVCMDFDHIEPSSKAFTISTKTIRASLTSDRDLSKQLILAEMEKCRLICANCHRIRTAIQNRRGVL